jgi:hypothetical protein
MKTTYQRSLVLGAAVSALFVLNGCYPIGSDSSSSAAAYVAKTPTAADAYEGTGGDNSLATASAITVGSLQNRTIYPIADEDWAAVNLEMGKIYEFSASNLQETGDSEIYLYDENGTEIDNNDDNVDYDSAISDYNATYTGTYYVKVIHLDNPSGTLSYQMGVREYVDADNDGYSTFFDCNDNNDTINPWASDIGGNGIDENCDGIDAVADTTADAYESDDTLETAKPIPTTYGSMEEHQNRYDIQSQMRTIHTAGDVDFLKITVAPYSGGEVIEDGMGSLEDVASQSSFEILDENGTVVDTGSFSTNTWLDNTTATTATYYLRVFANDGTSTGGYMPAYVSFGEDRDGDGYYTMDWVGSEDCNDANASIYSGATDDLGDGIDANCDGIDG